MDSNNEQTKKRASVGGAWMWLLGFAGGMTAIAFAVWGTLSGAPSWFHALFGFQALWAISTLVSAYKRRGESTAGQRPV